MMLSNITVVTLYDTLGRESIEYILNQCEIKTIICSADKIKSLIDLKVGEKIPHISHIIYFDEVKADLVEMANEHGITLVSFTDAVN